jgi:hypothetical protein
MLIAFTNKFKKLMALECMRSNALWRKPESITNFFTYFKDNEIDFENINHELSRRFVVLAIYNIGEVGPLKSKPYKYKHVFFRNNFKFDWLLATKKEEFTVDAIIEGNKIVFVNLFNGEEEKLIARIIKNDKLNKENYHDCECNSRYNTYMNLINSFSSFDYDEDSNIIDSENTGDKIMNQITRVISGNGIDKVFTVNHPFNTKHVHIDVYDSDTYSDIIVEKSRVSNSSVEIRFEEPVPDCREFIVLVSTGTEV